ncbi:helix-turn-helix domain-containing protein [Candidatus Enterococcus murrayae]|uniref:Helix-turn-helix transcriptional regulator n=1 Tax=Candidatus Enterococcus murrayae TaxID=2815321 RepID=A0ABS3HJD2_9ENTE|nr:helix-turn-helix transcriptional regulator [Enterococcus sp. MJM16]MBO0453577.1 helix-turn-helix transcriptional regulator [Enterococcus sp. MJM16]
MEIGKTIRSKREAMKMTQQQLADQIYVTRQTISKWELGKSEPDAISKKSLERVLAVQLVEESSSKKGEEERFMRKFQWGLGLLLFGIVFLPLRVVWVTIRRNWKQPWNRFVLLPTVFAFLLWYLHSLKDNVFNLFLALLLLSYFSTSWYFFSDQREIGDN